MFGKGGPDGQAIVAKSSQTVAQCWFPWPVMCATPETGVRAAASGERRDTGAACAHASLAPLRPAHGTVVTGVVAMLSVMTATAVETMVVETVVARVVETMVATERAPFRPLLHSTPSWDRA